MELDGGEHDEFQPQESVERNFAKVGKGARVVFELTTPIQKHLLVVEISATPSTNVNGLAPTANVKIYRCGKCSTLQANHMAVRTTSFG